MDNPQNKNQKNKKNIYLTIGLLVIIIVGALGALFIFKKDNSAVEEESPKEEESSDSILEETADSLPEEDMIFKEEEAPLPDWIANDADSENEGPWFFGLYMAESEDGLTFTDEKLFLEHSGVANLIMTSDEQLIATFQYFSFINEELFDVIAYSTSNDFGETWTSIKPIQISGLNQGANPCDPTLVELEEGRFRLYFTYQEMGEDYPQLFSAIGDSIDSVFLSEGQQLSTDEIILDPAVVYFNGMWHHYTVKHGQDFDSGDEPSTSPVSVHSVSSDGLAFELVDEIAIDMQMLGDVIEVDGGLRFYGGSTSAFSSDGYTWTMDEGERVQGADPGVVKSPEGSYLIIYTKVGEN